MKKKSKGERLDWPTLDKAVGDEKKILMKENFSIEEMREALSSLFHNRLPHGEERKVVLAGNKYMAIEIIEATTDKKMTQEEKDNMPDITYLFKDGIITEYNGR
jgi:hypothetical protein